MPELPEVETMRRGLLPIEGLSIVDVQLPDCQLKPLRITPDVRQFRSRVSRIRIARLDRLGKRVVVHLESQDAIIFEPRMTGLVLLADPPNRQHLRFELALDSREYPHLWYWDRRGLGAVQLLSPPELEALRTEKLGPDALRVEDDELRAGLKSSRRAIKVALLDQAAVAGIGNIYASEILHLAGVHPATRCQRLNRKQWSAIHRAMREVLLEAVEHEGSTLSDGTYRNALNSPGNYQNEHRVYDRGGETCPSCGTGSVRRIVQTQRSTFFCPHCQTRTGCRP